MNIEPQAFQSSLLDWFRLVARQMPWRDDPHPYAVWVSEIMLQQTQVETVKPYFLRFMSRFPTVKVLAEAPLDSVLKLWEGLGYYSRARNLHRGAQYVMTHFAGEIPQTPDLIRQIPGIGPYSAGAILSIAYQVAEPAIDGNVIRVFSRLYAMTDSVDKAATKKLIDTRVRALISSTEPGDFNQGLMELGALICKPRAPRCSDCPLSAFCQAYQAGKPETFPVKAPKKKSKVMPLAVALIPNEQGKFLLEKQTEKGIFKGLWCFPCLDYGKKKPEQVLKNYVATQYGVDVILGNPLTEIEHVLTHRRLKMKVYLCEPLAKSEAKVLSPWVDVADHGQYAVPIAHQKIMRFIESHPLVMMMYQDAAN